jgi:hypothetical protein
MDIPRPPHPPAAIGQRRYPMGPVAALILSLAVAGRGFLLRGQRP